MTEENETGAEQEVGMEQGELEEGGGEQGSEESLLAQLKLESESNYDKYIRAVAELENTKKRAIKERSEIIKYAGESLARDLLDIVDNFERAMQQYSGDENDPFAQGIRMILGGLQQTLERHSVKGESAVGKLFDPQRHEALASVPTSDKPAGTVLEEFRKTYFFKDKLLRAGQVVVAVQPAESAPAEGSDPSTQTEE